MWFRSIRRLSQSAYSHMPTSQPFLCNTIGQQLQLAVHKSPDKLAAHFVADKVQLSFQQLHTAVLNVAANLLSLGVRKGDRVGMWDVNSPQWLITQFATAQIGAVLVNVNPLYRSAELMDALKKVGVSVLIMRQQFKSQNFHAVLTDLSPQLRDAQPGKEVQVSQLPLLKKVIVIDSAENENKLPAAAFARYSELQRTASKKQLEEVAEAGSKLSFDDPIQIIFTSGTTGFPKGATLTHHFLLNNAHAIGRVLAFDQNATRICSPMPFYHIGGSMNGNMQIAVHNSTVVVPSKSYDADSVLRAAQETKATVIYGTPTMYYDQIALQSRAKYDLSSVKLAGIGGAPVPPDLVNAIVNKLGIPDVRVAYGSTEVGVVTLNRATDSLELRRNTVGQAMESVEIKVIKSNGETCQVDEQGEVCSRGYNTMLGYYNDSAGTSQAINAARWYLTGDLGSIDQSGYLKINGRIKDLVIRGGRNIYPAEIEMFLLQHDKVADVSVLGVPDERLGEELCACIRLKAGQTVGSDELRDFLKDKIAIFKVPKYYVLMDKEFPMTVSRKVKKYELRETVIKQLNLQNVKQ